jgi:hypothetical protein
MSNAQLRGLLKRLRFAAPRCRVGRVWQVVSGEWDEAVRHYDEEGVAAVLLAIGVIKRLGTPSRW